MLQHRLPYIAHNTTCLAYSVSRGPHRHLALSHDTAYDISKRQRETRSGIGCPRGITSVSSAAAIRLSPLTLHHALCVCTFFLTKPQHLPSKSQTSPSVTFHSTSYIPKTQCSSLKGEFAPVPYLLVEGRTRRVLQ